MATPIVDFSTFPNLRYRNPDIQNVAVAIAGEPKQIDLEGITNSIEQRDHIFYVRLRDKKELLVKPYLSVQEREVIPRLHNSEVSGVVGFNKDYFVEEGIRTPSIDSALESKSVFLDEVAGLFGKALYIIHSRGISYNQKFNNRVFADDITGKVRISDFSKAQLSRESAPFIVDLMEAFNYMESLARSYGVKEQDFFKAVDNFVSSYALEDRSREILMGTATHYLYNEQPQNPVRRALERTLKHK